METKMKELDQRGEIQKALEIEVDRLYRLNELRSLCNVSLRHENNPKKIQFDNRAFLLCVSEDTTDQIIEREGA